MTCARCGKYFCWNCLVVILGYDHFAENPLCGDIIAAAVPDFINTEEFGDRELVVKDVLKYSSKCPKCQEIVTKSENINLLECHKCKTEFCHICGKVTPEGKAHYDTSNCYYQD